MATRTGQLGVLRDYMMDTLNVGDKNLTTITEVDMVMLHGFRKKFNAKDQKKHQGMRLNTSLGNRPLHKVEQRMR